MDIQEADIAAMGREELEELIDRAVRPDVPLRVLFAALDRYTELLRPVLDDEGESAPEPAASEPPVSGAAVSGPALTSAAPPKAPGAARTHIVPVAPVTGVTMFHVAPELSDPRR
ncbi:MAG: hypothetical protein HOW97_16685 [Catenulispora sp.]|nr:hypothetical protein [Catenulispora sp.]